MIEINYEVIEILNEEKAQQLFEHLVTDLCRERKLLYNLDRKIRSIGEKSVFLYNFLKFFKR